jgi:hypothetical protein
MVLHTGELIRSYHKTEYESYIHQRKDGEGMRDKNILVSFCSIDGLDYEYRNLSESKQDYFSDLMDLKDISGQYLLSVDKKIDNKLYDNLSVLLIEKGIKLFNINVKHKGEYININSGNYKFYLYTIIINYKYLLINIYNNI